jgi:NADH dehydrogenase
LKTEVPIASIVIVGCGFGGLAAAMRLARYPLHVTVIDRNNHHLFQPLLYQVATAGLSPADIATPIRSVLRRPKNTEVLLGEVTGIDLKNQCVLLRERTLSYDYLVVTTGARHSYFGHPEWEKFAPGLKSIQDATNIRTRILLAFEQAENETHEQTRKALLTFVIVGAGPTGVELAGAIAELAHVALASDFRQIDPRSAQIILLEAGPKILSSFPDVLSTQAQQALENLGVLVRLNVRVEDVSEDGVVASGERIYARTVIWAAGVVASPAGQWLNADMDSVGRVKVSPDLSLPGHPNVFVIGDTATVLGVNGKPLSGVASVAMQQGVYVGAMIARELRGTHDERIPFYYVDKGNLATIGRAYAVVAIGSLNLSGFLAWVIWLVVHIFYLIGFRNRLLVLIQWVWAYMTFQRGARLITK